MGDYRYLPGSGYTYDDEGNPYDKNGMRVNIDNSHENSYYGPGIGYGDTGHAAVIVTGKQD